MEAELKKMMKSDCNLIVCNTSDIRTIKKHNAQGVVYYTLPGGYAGKYKITARNISYWKKILKTEKPDIIHVWGTEYNMGLAALIANEGQAKSCIFIQGVMKSIAQNYRGDLTPNEMIKNLTVSDILLKRSIFHMERKMKKQAELEREYLTYCKNLIVETTWAKNMYDSIMSGMTYYYNRLTLMPDFYRFNWDMKHIARDTILCTASGYPLKGLHFLIRALYQVAKIYPQIKLYVPGPKIEKAKNMKEKALQSGYHNYILKLISNLNLENNIHFIGNQSSAELAELLSVTHIFVSASTVENHCSSLREAMLVGTPSICTAVGGIPEYAKNDYNCLMYQYDDVDALANNIIMLLRDDSLCERLSINGKNTINKIYQEEKMDTLNEIYEKMVNKI